MKTIKGPAVFLAQFVDKKAPFNSLEGMCKWAADLGYKGIQIPTWESFLIDLDKAAESKDLYRGWCWAVRIRLGVITWNDQFRSVSRLS